MKQVTFQELPITIEFPKGAKRPYRDDSGDQKYNVMKADYGFVKGTKGVDGDDVDVFLGPEGASSKAFVIRQMKKPDFKTFDEEKVVLGCSTQSEAKALYLANYNDPRFCGGITELSMEKFKDRLATRGQEGAKLAQRRADLVETCTRSNRWCGDPARKGGARQDERAAMGWGNPAHGRMADVTPQTVWRTSRHRACSAPTSC